MAHQIGEVLNERQDHIARQVPSVATSSQTVKTLKEALKAAEQIRLQLADRAHSDSTEMVSEDRER
jgi:F0F1-type ATP synthase membrane subunit b/b'